MNQRPKTVSDAMMRQAVIRKPLDYRTDTRNRSGIAFRKMMVKAVDKIPAADIPGNQD